MRNFYAYSVFAICFLSSVCAFAQPADLKLALERSKTLSNSEKYDSAIIYADSALHLAKKYNDHSAQITAIRNKGKSLFGLHKQKEAVDLYFDALRLCKEPGDNRQIALLYSDIGYTYFSQGHYKEAKSYYQKELAIRKISGGKDSIGNQLINLSVMHQDLKEYDSALLALNQVAAILDRNNDSDLRGYYCLNRGSLLQFLGNADSAAWYYKESYTVWTAIKKESQAFKAVFNLGFLAEQQKDYKAAFHYYDLSKAAAMKYGMQREIAHVYGTMAEAYAEVRDYRNAYDNLYKYAILSDSLSKSDFNNYVVKLDKQFESKKNQETIQQQQLKLNAAELETQRQKNRTLLMLVIFIAIVLAGVILFGYLNFRNRVHKQVEAAKGRFFANVVHEIRTPLSMIQGPIKVLQSKVTDEALHYQLDIAERNTNRLNDLINQMLDISKIDEARYKLKESIGNPCELLNEIAEQYAAQAADKNIKLTASADTSCGNRLFDKDALEKIVGNLLSNAIKYTPSGGTVGMEAIIGNDDPGHLIIHVWDTGIGLHAEDQARIFDRFYRAKEQEKAGTRGIGIGLALVRDLVSLMNGTIEVESEISNGCVFTLRLPLKQLHNSVALREEGRTGGNIILLVEDDKDILDFNRTLLAESGFHVITATNGDEALTLLEDQLPDLVVTDLMMPGKDGLALLKEIRASDATDHIPVIILSAKASPQSKMEGLTEGAQVYLPKPFQPDELLGLVKNQLQILQKHRVLYQQLAVKDDKPVEERFSGTDPFTRKCFSIIQERLDDAQLSVEKLAELMNINRSHFQRKIKALTGYSPSELIRMVRLEKAKDMLLKREGNITEIAYSTGFTSQSYFTKCFSEQFGYPPSQLLATRPAAGTQV